MLNLLRSDFYRLFKSKSFYICLAVQVIYFAVVQLALYKLLEKSISAAAKASGEAANILPNGGFAYGLTAFGGNLSTIASIIIAIFIIAEFTYGTMKNVVSKGFSKIQIYLSKLITMIVATYIMILASIVVGSISGTIVIGKFGDVTADMMKNAGMEFLLFTALTAIFVFISIAVKNLGGVIAINIVGVLSFGPLIYKLLEFLIKSKIDFNKFSLLNNITYFVSDTALKGSDYLRAAIVAIIYFAVTVALGIYVFVKSDIK